MSEPTIDVIMRTGGRPTALLERAVSSLARQSAGAVRLLLIRHGPADVEALRTLIGGALRSIEVIDAPGANRGRAMAAGLARVAAPYFAFLDDDDYLLEDHLRHLLRAVEDVAGLAFAYCDILVLDEAAPEAGLRLFREGPAQPPLGRITDRISVNAFLAERAALDGLPFDRWGLATAEDALLVAALLSRSTPVHTPHATCVYVQGRSDASAYLAHPDRAADELSFAREIAPARAMIEGKFGVAEIADEATYLAPFIAAARHAELFGGLKMRHAKFEIAAIRDAALATPVANDPGLATIAAPLAFEAVTGLVHETPSGGVEIEADQDYAYAARTSIDLPTDVRPAVISIQVSSGEGAFGLALADADHTLVAEARVDPRPIPLEIQLLWDRPEPPTLIVRRLSALGVASPHIRIDGFAFSFHCEALAGGGDRAEALKALTALARTPRSRLSPALAIAPRGEGRAILGETVEVELGETPWAYAFSWPLPSEAADAAMRVDLSPAPTSVFVLRVDTAWSAVGKRVEAPTGGRPNRLWLEPLTQGEAARLVIQAGAAPAGARVTLRGVFLYPNEAA